MDIINTFLTRFGHKDGGSVRTDQGGELARSTTLPDNLLRQHNYIIEPTGANSPSQNGAVEIYNGKLAVCTHSLLFGSGLLAKIPEWRSWIQGAYLIQLNGQVVNTITDVVEVFEHLVLSECTSVMMLFAHPKIRPSLSQEGVPIISCPPFSLHTHEQMNNRWEFTTVRDLLQSCKPSYKLVLSGDVLNVITRVMHLTQGKLMKQPDWEDWQQSEFLQLDQYDTQGMFGPPVKWQDDMVVFHSVWTYAIKAVDSRKKTRWACDGSSWSGQEKILDETYANCVDQTSSRIFYAIAAAENLLVYGADVSNAFAEAPPPKQGFYIHPDRAFQKWWTIHKQRPPIPDGAVIPILSAMQGHPESPRLWEKHADAILRECGLVPMVHEPCLYSGLIANKRVLLMRQVDDFAVAAPDERTASVLLDMIDDKLTIPMKRQGLLDMYNGIDIVQTCFYIKLTCTTYINKICDKFISSWMRNFTSTDIQPTPFPNGSNLDEKVQRCNGRPRSQNTG
jgi:hypothetical protein